MAGYGTPIPEPGSPIVALASVLVPRLVGCVTFGGSWRSPSCVWGAILRKQQNGAVEPVLCILSARADVR